MNTSGGLRYEFLAVTIVSWSFSQYNHRRSFQNEQSLHRCTEQGYYSTFLPPNVPSRTLSTATVFVCSSSIEVREEASVQSSQNMLLSAHPNSATCESEEHEFWLPSAMKSQQLLLVLMILIYFTAHY
jgi:hypothetical protein